MLVKRTNRFPYSAYATRVRKALSLLTKCEASWWEPRTLVHCTQAAQVFTGRLGALSTVQPDEASRGAAVCHRRAYTCTWLVA